MESSCKVTVLSNSLSSQGFVLSELLCEMRESKTLVFLCSRENKQGVVVLQLRDWIESDARRELLAAQLTLQVQNAEYANYAAQMGTADVKVTWPADEHAVAKWRVAALLVVRETPEQYRAGTLCHVNSLSAAHTQWVDNILAGTKEQDRVWLNHQDFVLVPDFKMDIADTSTLYLQLLFRDSSLRSLRDFSAAQLPLLRRVREALLQECANRGFKEHELRLFFHYFPTFWRAHLHVAHVRCLVPGGGLNAGRAVLLEDVITNLELVPDYYHRVTLVSAVRVGTPHHAALQKIGAVE